MSWKRITEERTKGQQDQIDVFKSIRGEPLPTQRVVPDKKKKYDRKKQKEKDRRNFYDD